MRGSEGGRGSNRFRRRARRVPLVIALVMSCVAPVAAQDDSWLAVPAPSVEGLEPSVAAQLERLREHVAARVADSGVPAADLGEAFGELGRHYQAYDLSELAERCYSIARRLAPEDFRWPYLTGYLKQSGGRLEEAVESYQTALGIFNEVPPAWVRLGLTYRALNRLDDAEGALRTALALDPTSAAAHAGLGQVLHDAGRFEEAVAALEKALELEPDANLLYYPLGLSYRALGDLDKAGEALVRHGEVGVRPADPLVDEFAQLTTGERVHLIRGRAAFDAGRFEEAAVEFRRAVELEPGSVRARVNLGSALAQLDQVDAAILEFEEALRIGPGNTAALFNLGSLRERRGELELAAASYQEAAGYSPRDAEVRLGLAEVQRALGDLENALSNFGKAVAIDAGAETGWIGEADVLARLGRFDEALSRLETAQQLMPTSGRIAHGLARLLAACPEPSLRDGERALDLALRVAQAQPNVAHVRTVAMALAESGRCEEAAEWQGRAVDAAREGGDQRSAEAFEAARATYAAGPPCRPPIGVTTQP